MKTETEVLRIEGNLVISKEIHGKFRFEFINLLSKLDIEWVGSIVPHDSPTGMRLYRVEDIEALDSKLKEYYVLVDVMKMQKESNDRLVLSLSEELTKERERSQQNEQMIITQINAIRNLENDITILKFKLRMAEQTRWRTFTKWWKELWKVFIKSFRSTVNQ